MNISNAIYEFTDDLVGGAAVGSILNNCNIHADIYEDIKPGKTIRVDDVRSATPALVAGNTIRKDNAVLSVHFLKMPDSQKLADRLAARQMAEDMADEWIKQVFLNPTLSNRICIIGKVSQFNDWIRPGTVKIPVCVLRIQVNPR